MSNTSNIDIARAIYLSAKDKDGADKAFLGDVVKFLVRKRFLHRAGDILLSLKKIINQEDGIIIAKVNCAKTLSEESKKSIIDSIKKRYSAKEVVLEERYDENLLGGMKIEANNEIIDLTVKNKIKKLQEYLIRKV